MAPSDLPAELSPLAENVEFFQGGVRTRRGLTRLVDGTAGSSANRGASRHITSFWASPPNLGPTGINIQFADGGTRGSGSGGSLAAGPQNLFTDVGWPYSASTFAYANINGLKFQAASAELGDRIYVGFHDGNSGWAPALQYDGVNLAQVAQEGPGEGPQMTNGAAGGSVAAGTRYAICVFVTRQGYTTGASYLQNLAAHTWTFGNKITFVDIPVASPPSSGYIQQVTHRKIFVTPAGGDQYDGPYYCITSKMTVEGNTTTTLADVDFTEAELIAGESFDDLADLIPCVWPASFSKHKNRLIAVAPLNAMYPGLQSNSAGRGYYTVSNTSFAGGLCNGNTRLAGWATPAAGGEFIPEVVPILGGDLLHARYAITGTAGLPVIRGAMASRGAIFNQATSEVTNNDYGFWVIGRARASGTVGAGDFIRFSATSASTRTRLRVNLLNNQWTGFAIRLSDTVNANVTPEIALENDAGGMSSTIRVEIAEFYIVPHGDLFLRNTMFVSRPGFPEAFDGIFGRLTISHGVGQLRTPFSLRDNLFAPKDRSIWSVQDNGGNPVEWQATPVSETVGTQSFLGAKSVDGYALIATHDGAYLFTGGTPDPIATEIQKTWLAFDKRYTNTYQVAVDESGKRAYFLVYGASAPEIWVLDYFEGFGDPVPSGQGRKWSKFTSYRANNAALTFTAIGRQYVAPGTIGDSRLHPMVFGNNQGDSGGNNGGYMQYLTSNQYFDQDPAGPGLPPLADAPVRSTYKTGPFGSEIGRSLFQQALLRIGHPSDTASTSGTFHWYIERPDGSQTTQQDGTASNATVHEFESPIRHPANQQDLYLHVGIQAGTTYGTDVVGAAFTINRLGVSFKPAPNAPIKGHN